MTGFETAIAIAGVAVSVAAAGVGTYMQIQQQEQNAKLAESAAEAADIEAGNRQAEAAYSERQFRRKAALLMGQQNAIYAASGVDPSSGSPLFQEIDTAKQAEIEALNIRRGGDVAAASSRFEAQINRYRSSFYQSQVAPTAFGGALSAGSSILSGWVKQSKYSA